MTCKQCKYITVCMAQADGLGQVFDPNYDGEHGCTDFAPFTNADRIRSMIDQELAAFLSRDLKEPCDYCQLAVFEGACCVSFQGLKRALRLLPTGCFRGRLHRNIM